MAKDILRDVGSEILEKIRGCVVLMDFEGAEFVRWSVGLDTLVASGATSLHTPPWQITNHLSSRIMVILGKFLIECQKDMTALLSLPQISSLQIFSLFSDQENLAVTSNEFGYTAFTEHCSSLLQGRGAATVVPKIVQLFVSLFFILF